MDKEKVSALAEWLLEKDKDYYPAEAMQEGTCVREHLLGRCGGECLCYLNGDCPIEDEVDEALGFKEVH